MHRRFSMTLVVRPVSCLCRVFRRRSSPSGRRRNGLPYVLELVDDLRRRRVDRSRSHLRDRSVHGGFGAFGASRCVPSSSRHRCRSVVAGETVDMLAPHKVPMWIFHGDADRWCLSVIPVTWSRLFERPVVRLDTEYEGVGHNSWLNAYGSEELWVWFFKQRRTPADSIEESGGLDNRPSGLRWMILPLLMSLVSPSNENARFRGSGRLPFVDDAIADYCG